MVGAAIELLDSHFLYQIRWLLKEPFYRRYDIIVIFMLFLSKKKLNHLEQV